jgi:hypothetical protein
MNKISIKDSYFISWSVGIGMAIGIAFCSNYSDYLTQLIPYSNIFVWILLVLLPTSILLSLCGYGFFSLILYFIKEKVSTENKLLVAISLCIPLLLYSTQIERFVDLLLDNGGDEIAEIEIIEVGQYNIPPHDCITISVPLAPLTIIAPDNDTTNFTPSYGRYLYNYKNYNFYEIQSLSYVPPDEASRFSFYGSERKILSVHYDKIFLFSADFLFDAPETIQVKGEKRQVEQSVLLRMKQN